MSDFNTIVNDTEVKLPPRAISWAKVSALVALVNFLLVLFHFSYTQLRPLYLNYFPSLVKVYDPFKGIDPSLPNPEYLKTADGFWRIDAFFICFFGMELLIKTLFHSRRKPGVTWFDFVLRRWYEVFLLIPIWQGWRILPVLVRLHKSGLVNLDRKEMTEQLANYLAQTAVDVVATTYEDDEGRKIIDNFSQEFNESLRRELQDEKTLSELQSLLSDLLEEVKLNYIQGGLKSDPEETLIELESLREVTES